MLKRILTLIAIVYKPAFINQFLSHLAIIICILILTVGEAIAQYTARIVKVDEEHFPTIRVSVSITDSQGNPIPDSLSVKLSLLEDGRVVSEDTLAQEWTVSSVLVLDVSGSMGKDEKLVKAKEAACNYIRMAPSNYQIAVVRFSNPNSIDPYGVGVVGDFKDTRDALCRNVRDLSAKGATALQDGIGKALELLSGRSDRKDILVLTDGLENNSYFFKNGPGNYEGQERLIQLANAAGCTISTIGLGKDEKDAKNINAEYLQRYKKTGGRYFFCPDANQLQAIFYKAVKLLEKEKVIPYETSYKFADGAWRNLSVVLRIGDASPYIDNSGYTPPGVLPHVRGDHTLWFILLLGLLVFPRLLFSAGNLVSVRQFRSSHLMRIVPGSTAFGKQDLNGMVFSKDSVVVKCPGCSHLHHIRSWRLNCCTCMYNRRHEAKYCYHRKYPRWLRQSLDFLSGEKNNETGRTWLCRCAGDKDGY